MATEIKRLPDRVIVTTDTQQTVFRIDGTGEAAAIQMVMILEQIEDLKQQVFAYRAENIERSSMMQQQAETIGSLKETIATMQKQYQATCDNRDKIFHAARSAVTAYRDEIMPHEFAARMQELEDGLKLWCNYLDDDFDAGQLQDDHDFNR